MEQDGKRYPFADYPVFASTDIDEVREKMARIMCPHVLKPLDAGFRLDAVMNSMPLDHLVLSYVHYGAPVYVGPGRTQSFTAVQIPVAGHGTILNGLTVVDSSPERILVSRPDEPLGMKLSADTRLLLVKVPTEFMTQKLSDVLGGLLGEELRFEPGMDVTKGLQRRWLEDFVNHVQHMHLFARRLYLPIFEERFVLSLLFRQENNYSDILAHRAVPASPVKRREAQDLLHATPDDAHTEGSIARSVDVSLRSLQQAFHGHLGRSVGEYLADVRLRRAREELLQAAPYETTVRAVAARWGFVEPNFSLRFIATYGEWPIDTLRGR
ncbi:AraC family transcriptional regulator [Amycolatopsis sp. K13G38]|uniref:AraC family transcriptional regulator n=1 Tax=Amycolatopsis acididurans TaxID=2724524 RepID=A0ABX1J6W3_9PSEU|nr:AraC family transcriptional regulator [Amycolatopsis acididurans]NKQ55031.1 AraC family transcriptional regulator [Amycolatopsis acididurans]